MARMGNPYRADAGPYTDIGQGVNNLASAFLASQPDPVKTAQAQAYAWKGRESQENVLDSMDARQGRFQLGDQLASYDPSGDNRQLFAQGVGTGAMEVDDLGKLMLAMNANFGGSDDQVGRSMLGTGKALGENDFVSIADRESGREANALNDRLLDANSQTLNEVLGGKLRSGEYSLGDIYKAQYPNRYASAANGGGSGKPTDPLINAKRISDLERQALGTIDVVLQDSGVPEDQLALFPMSERQRIASEAVEAAKAGTPINSYVIQEMGNLGIQFTDDNNWWWGAGEPELTMGGQPATQPRPTSAQPAAAPDATLQEAVQAVQRGAPAAAVRDRLYQMGYTDDQLARAGF